jgi:tRNA A37 threonylcarbamoyladenosine dehydratase
MPGAFSRTERLLGKAGMDRLAGAVVAVFGVGGVGSYAVEALARSGVGGLALFDDDKVCLTNINRQLIATHDTIGQSKVEAAQQRILSINPKCRVEANTCFYTAQNADEYDLSRYTYIIDAIDTVSSKLVLIERAAAAGVPVISCMGAGNKLDATRFEIADIYQTSVCPLAKVMRRELKARGIAALKVVYSKEPPIAPREDDETGCQKDCVCPPDTTRKCGARRQVPGSVAFVPSVAGLILAGQAIRDMLEMAPGARL